LLARVAPLGDSSQVLTHDGDIELRSELQQPLCVDAILQSGVSEAAD
jgi:hypothetical protein